MKILLRLFIFIYLIGMLAGQAGGMTADELQVAIKAASPENAENITVQLEKKGAARILKIGRKIVINPLRHMIQVQSVDLRYVEQTPSIDKIGSQVQPWVKLRCKGGSDRVNVLEQVYLEGELLELESTEESMSVLVIPCDPYEIETLTAALTALLKDFE